MIFYYFEGDSGSPLMQFFGCRAVLIGISSFGSVKQIRGKCGFDQFYWTRISLHLDWIKYHIEMKDKVFFNEKLSFISNTNN